MSRRTYLFSAARLRISVGDKIGLKIGGRGLYHPAYQVINSCPYRAWDHGLRRTYWEN